MDPEYLTTAEAAAHLRVKERTLYDLVARRAVPCSRVTGKLIFPRRLLDQWVEANVEAPGAALGAPPPIVAGSSDPLLEWALRESGSGLATLFEGSEAGLRRFEARGAVAIGLHMIDERGEYNMAARRSLAGVFDLTMVQFARRTQGLIVAPGNPLDLTSLRGAAQAGARFAVRQPGSGSALLTQRLLAEAGLTPEDIAVAAVTRTEDDAAVADGRADCAVAIAAAARRLRLGFAPLHVERFDLGFRRRDFFEPALHKFFDFLRSAEFAARAAQLDGYDVSETGRVEFNA
ncbi:MAG: helix-turn-helix transcriptional regulator [Hyphomicrobiales bacterium]|nr:helix-turn-helix transcriptional regulator [Hyphomicrobiales bacterium]